MSSKLTCEQVLSLMSFYFENKLSEKLKFSIETHLNNCKKCRAIYSTQKADLSLLSDKYFDDSGYFEKLSAYIDNELCYDEALKMRKIAISNPAVRNDLEMMYRFRNLLNDSVNRTKNLCRKDYAKNIINEIKGENVYNSFNKLVWTFVLMMTIIFAGFLFLLNF